ncbi:MAG: LptA/OstA family protein [Archangium sp.]
MVTALVLSLALAAPDGGVLLARPVRVQADKLQVFKKESRALYSGHAKAVRDSMTLTCNELEVFFDDQSEIDHLIARGNVEVVDGDRQAWGENATYDNKNGVLTVTGNPRGRQGPREVDGEVVTFTTGTEYLVVTKAKTRVKEPKDKRVNIDADKLELWSKDREAKWTGKVRVVKDKTIINAPEITALYDDAGEVTRVKARGGVEVNEGDRWARGQFADYDVPKGVLVVTGNPQARQNKTRLRGSKVTFYSGTDFLEVDNATTIIEADKKGP